MRLTERSRPWLPWLLLAVAVVATTLVYWPGMAGGWVFDDYPNIVDNAQIHLTPGHADFIAWLNAALSSPSSFLHRPLASLTFAANWLQGNGNPWPFKVTNLIIHLINGMLVYCMLRMLLRLLALRGGHTGLPLRNEGGKRPPPSGGRGIEGDGFSTAATSTSPRATRDPLPSEGGAMSSGATAPLPPSSGTAERQRTRAKRDEGDGFPAIDDAAATRLALVVSAAWLLLPINLMAVLYVVQRMESLSQLFVLAGLWAYLHGRWMMLTADDAARETRGLSLAATGIVLGTVLGLAAKETAVLLPVFAFLAELVVVRFCRRDTAKPQDMTTSPCRSAAAPFTSEGGETLPPSGGRGIEGDARTDKRIWALFTITLFVPAMLGFLWLLRSALKPTAYANRSFTLVERLLTEPRVLVDYLHWTLLPNPMVLSLYHDEIVKSTGLLTPWTTLGSILLLAALIVAAVLVRKRHPLVSLGIGWFLGAQLLTATIIPLELVYEQRMYFGSIGVLLAAGSLLLGLHWKIRMPLLRGFLVAVALLWFGTATYLRAQEWSNPIKLAVAEAHRHPESPRAVYEAGRLLLIASNYKEGPVLTESWKYLRAASAIPGASALPDQAMIMIADHEHQGDDAPFWESMVTKLRDQPTRQEDISALVSLTNCYGNGNCKFDLANLQRAYAAALSHPHPIARLYGAYAAFQRDLMHNDSQATEYLELAVKGDPLESAYRVDLTVLYARHGRTRKALEQIDELRRMNLGGRLDGQIATLEKLAEQGRSVVTPTP